MGDSAGRTTAAGGGTRGTATAPTQARGPAGRREGPGVRAARPEGRAEGHRGAHVRPRGGLGAGGRSGGGLGGATGQATAGRLQQSFVCCTGATTCPRGTRSVPRPEPGDARLLQAGCRQPRWPLHVPLSLLLFVPSGQVVLDQVTPVRLAPVRLAPVRVLVKVQSARSIPG